MSEKDLQEIILHSFRGLARPRECHECRFHHCRQIRGDGRWMIRNKKMEGRPNKLRMIGSIKKCHYRNEKFGKLSQDVARRE